MVGEKCEFIVDRLQCICVPLFSSLKLERRYTFLAEVLKICWPLHKYIVVTLVCDICMGFCEVKVFFFFVKEIKVLNC